MPVIASKRRNKEPEQSQIVAEPLVIEDEPQPAFVSRAEIDAKAKEYKESKKLPIPPAEKASFEALLKWIQLLTPDMAEDNRIILYVYRLEPFSNRQMVDPKSDNNIDVIGGGLENLQSINEQYFIDKHGGGKYKLVVNDCAVKYGGRYFDAYLTIPMVQHPPKMDLREVEWDHKMNKGFKAWARANKLIDENNMPITNTQENKSNGVPSDLLGALKLIIDFTKQMNADQEKVLRKQLGAEDQVGKGIQEIILERLRQDDPNKQISTVSSLVSAMKSLIPEKSQSDLAVMVPLFIQMMQNQSENANKQFQMIIELMKSTRESNNGGGGGDRDEIGRIKDLLDVARELKGGGPPQKNVVAEVVESITPVLQPALQIVSNILALRAGGHPQPAQANNPNPGTVSRQSTIVHTPPAQPNPQPQQPQPVQDNTVTQDEATNLINQFKPIILNKLGREGWEFGAWVAEGFGDAVAASLAKYGVQGLLDAAKKVPDFWQHVNATYGEAYLREWLTSLVNYKSIMKKMEDEGEDEIEFKE